MSDELHATRIGAWANLGEPRTAIALEETGADWVCLDAQHGHFDDRSVRETMALRRQPKVPMLVRLLSDDGAAIGRALDSGADGVIVPMIESALQAANVVRASFHPPQGRRSFGPMAGISYNATDGYPRSNPLVAVMIETATGLENLEAIAATKGLDMLFVGPYDLALSVGTDVDTLIGDTGAESPLSRVIDACSAANLIPGAFGGTPVRARRLLERGFSWVSNCVDTTLIQEGFRAMKDISLTERV
jgi:4-hydroxy-2-oxoheptanedioate aldolase